MCPISCAIIPTKASELLIFLSKPVVKIKILLSVTNAFGLSFKIIVNEYSLLSRLVNLIKSETKTLIS